MKRKIGLGVILLFPLFLFWVKNNSHQEKGLRKTPYFLDIPKGFPKPSIPENNAMTQERVYLGRRLFYDPILSRDSTISCASCHRQALAFADEVSISVGIEGRKGFRNAPTLTNVAWQKRLNKDGGVIKLGIQAVIPIEDEAEMDFPLLEAAARLKKHPEYVELCQKAYGRPPDPFSITRALAAFERTLISGRSRYDLYTFHDQTEVLTVSELRGKALFFSEQTNCATCHSGFNFTNNQFENNGLQDSYPLDPGKKRITANPKDEGIFKVPTLRNIEYTAPYMHDGRVESLEAVIAHYNSGGSQHPTKSKLIRPLGLNKQEQKDVVSFLKTLTDTSFLQHPDFRPLITNRR